MFLFKFVNSDMVVEIDFCTNSPNSRVECVVDSTKQKLQALNTDTSVWISLNYCFPIVKGL